MPITVVEEASWEGLVVRSEHSSTGKVHYGGNWPSRFESSTRQACSHFLDLFYDLVLSVVGDVPVDI
jgi:hypothetical protein